MDWLAIFNSSAFAIHSSRSLIATGVVPPGANWVASAPQSINWAAMHPRRALIAPEVPATGTEPPAPDAVASVTCVAPSSESSSSGPTPPITTTFVLSGKLTTLTNPCKDFMDGSTFNVARTSEAGPSTFSPAMATR
ncbi:hypothetical protein ACFSGX_11780 [Sphingomonas arantia]|uniref:Uncharacterized protein n=1 Tax=Sphingomonas arantia TaxID=1460676 RepID=A0ABW4U1Q2_9SPHN